MRSLKELREFYGFTLKGLSEAMRAVDPDVPGAGISNIKNVETASVLPNIAFMAVLAQVYDTTIDALYFGTDRDPSLEALLSVQERMAAVLKAGGVEWDTTDDLIEKVVAMAAVGIECQESLRTVRVKARESMRQLCAEEAGRNTGVQETRKDIAKRVSRVPADQYATPIPEAAH
jgi:transcriptional regulator with XRE-family HTH domain